MKKLITILIILISLQGFSQTTKVFNTTYPNGMFGRKDTQIVTALHNVVNEYFTSFGTWGKLFDTARAAFSLTTIGSGAATYTQATGVFNIPTTTGGWALTGNAGITAVTNFLGTTDAKSLYIKTNGAIRAKFDSVGYSFIDGAYIGRGNIATVSASRATNLAFGDSALFTPSSTGSWNTAIGNSALAKDTGASNTAIGYEAMSVNIAGAKNTAVGYQALKAQNPSGSVEDGSTAIGFQSLTANNTGRFNAAGGYFSLKANTSGGFNTAFGANALISNISNSYNAGFGYGALQSTTGERNTATGGESMLTLTTGTNNSALGEASGYGITTGGYNIFAGSNPTVNIGITTGSYNTIIGSDMGAIGNLSNTVVLADGERHRYLWGNSSWQTGIRYTSPTAILQLAPGQINDGIAPLKFTHWELTTTAATSSLGITTLTFATQSVIPFTLNDSITVAGVTPSGFNGKYKVTGGTTSTVTFLNSTAGPQTVAGTIETGFLNTNPAPGAVEYNGTHFYGTDKTGTRYQLDQQSAGGGTVTSVTGTAPIVSSGGTTPAISIPVATSSVNGYLSSTDWSTFNSKGAGTVTSVAALTLGTTGSDLSSSVANGTTTPVITLNVPTASASNRGALSSTDWSTFNNSWKFNGTQGTSIPFATGILVNANASGNLTAGAESDYINEGDTLWQWYNTTVTRQPMSLRYSINSGASWSTPVATDFPKWFPQVEKFNGIYYCTGSTPTTETDVYLYSSTNKINWTALNGGSPVLSRTNTITDWRYQLFNTAFVIIRTNGADTIHYLCEGDAGNADGVHGYYSQQAFAGYAKAPLSSPAATLTTIPQIHGGNAKLFFIPEHNALFAAYGQYTGVFPDYSQPWRIRFAKASLANNLQDSTSWIVVNKYIQTGNWADPSFGWLQNVDSVIFYYELNQTSGVQSYIPHMRSPLQLYEAVVDTSISTSSPSFTGTTNVSALTLSGNLTTNLTAGSVPYISTAGLLTQDNSNFYWDGTNHKLGIGIASSNISDVLDVRRGATGNADGLTISTPNNSGAGSQPGLVFKRYTAGTLNSVAKIVSGQAVLGANDGDLAFMTGAGTTPAIAMYIGSGGKVGIGNSSPTSLLSVGSNTFQVNSSGAIVAATGITQTGNITLSTAGNKLNIATGSNASVGVSTLVGGTVTVSTTAVTASSKIFLTDATTGVLTNVGSPTVGTIVAGTSFVINSTNVLDTSAVNWLIIN